MATKSKFDECKTMQKAIEMINQSIKVRCDAPGLKLGSVETWVSEAADHIAKAQA